MERCEKDGMGVCEKDRMFYEENTRNKEQSANIENIIKESVTICQTNKEATPQHIIIKKLQNFFKKHTAERLLIAGLILVIIGLTAALIIVWTRPTSCELNEVGEHRTITPAAERTEIKTKKSAPCEDDWIWYRGKCYYFSTERDTWRNSKEFCISHNSSLAIIESKEELVFLFRRMGTDRHWIGMRRTDDDTAWIWIDGSPYDESLFKIRRKPQENNERVYLNSGNVESDGGNFPFKWICNKE